MGKVTIKEIASKAGVSLATVSRVLNGSLKVDPGMRSRVLAAAQELNYLRGPQRHADPERTKRIALVVPALANSYFSEVAAGVIDRARENGQEVVVMHTQGKRELEHEAFRRVLESKMDGVIFSGATGENPRELFPEFRNLPMVIAARRQVVPGIPHVYHDNRSAGYMAAKYLLRLNRKRIALLLDFWGNSVRDYGTFLKSYNSSAQGAFPAFDRFAGYCRALEEEGLEVNPDLIVFSGLTYESGYESAQSLLAGTSEFDAVMVSNDRCATGVLKLLQEQGIFVPGQVSMICFNGGLISSVVSPALTIVEQNNYELGVQAAAQLNELICGREGRDVMLDVNLKIKGSTALGPAE